MALYMLVLYFQRMNNEILTALGSLVVGFSSFALFALLKDTLNWLETSVENFQERLVET